MRPLAALGSTSRTKALATAVGALVLASATLTAVLSLPGDAPGGAPDVVAADEGLVAQSTLVCPTTESKVALVHAQQRADGVTVGAKSPAFARLLGDPQTEPLSLLTFAIGSETPKRAQGTVDSAALQRLDAASEALVIQARGVRADRTTLARPGPNATVECDEPSRTAWFTGVGAGSRYSSAVELVNAGNSPAVADIIVRGVSGVIDVPQLRGVAVAPRGKVRLDLAEIVPRREELSLQVQVVRGRVATFVRSKFDALNGSTPRVDWIPAQTTPARQLTLLGAYPGNGQRAIVVSNPSDNAASLKLRLLGRAARFAPVNAAELIIGAQSVTRIDLAPFLAGATEEVLGVELTASEAITATYRAVVNRDLLIAAPSEEVTQASLIALPGPKNLILAAADGGSPDSEVGVDVIGLNARGRVLTQRSATLTPAESTVVELPKRTEIVRFAARNGSVSATLLVQAKGTAAQRARPIRRSVTIPELRRVQ